MNNKPRREQTASEWSQGNRDLLIELKTQMVNMVDAVDGLHTEIKEIKDGMKSDIEFLKSDKISRAEAVRIQVDNSTIATDHESRLRFIERYVWLALGALGVAEFLVLYFHPVIH